MDMIYGICPRCGTTSMVRAIRQSCRLRCTGEPFSWRGGFCQVYSDESMKTKTRSLEEARSMLEDKGVQLIKHVDFALTTKENLHLLNTMNNVIFMYRKHYVDVFLSRYMNDSVSSDLRLWHKTPAILKSKRYQRRQELYSNEMRPAVNIGKMKSEYRAAKKKWNKVLRPRLPDGWGVRKSVMFIEYGSTYNTDKIYECFFDVVNFLGISIFNNKWKELLSPQIKLNNEEVYSKVIPNYEEVMSYRDKLILE